LPGIFGVIGVVLLFVGVFPALKKFNLYKTGIIKEANVVSISSNNAVATLRTFQSKFLVDYYFSDGLGNKIFGNSTTTDFLLVNDKKAGDTVKIFVDEGDQTKTCLVPRLEAMKYNWSI
jgi:hypothetical protein